MSVKELTYSTWRQFKSEFLFDLFGVDAFRGEVYLFRGQRDHSWPLETSFDRWFRVVHGATGNRVEVAKRLLMAFKIEALRHGLVEEKTPEVEMMALARHYGLPTRLLDWSLSPYVAAFFALNEAVVNGNATGIAAVWALDTRIDIWTPDLGVEIVATSAVDNPRLRNQRGRFTWSRTPFSTLEEYAQRAQPASPALVKASLPVVEAATALADLDSMGINHASTYPELIGCALAAQARILLER